MATEEKKIEEFDDFIPFEIVRIRDGESNGQLVDFTIHESEGGSDYWDWIADMSRFSTDFAKRKPDDKTLTKLQEELLCLCMKHNGSPVKAERVAKWGKSLKDRLFEKCQEKNGNTRGEIEAEGKDSGNAETTGSGSALPNDSTAQSPTPSAS